MPLLLHILIVVYSAALAFILYAFFCIIPYVRCKTCNKKYRRSKSGSQYTNIFCSELCEYQDMLESLLKEGIPVEQVTALLTKKYPKYARPGSSAVN